eukprot:1160080-Pelagomonas_calceolata.AAC.20
MAFLEMKVHLHQNRRVYVYNRAAHNFTDAQMKLKLFGVANYTCNKEPEMLLPCPSPRYTYIKTDGYIYTRAVCNFAAAQRTLMLFGVANYTCNQESKTLLVEP